MYVLNYMFVHIHICMYVYASEYAYTHSIWDLSTVCGISAFLRFFLAKYDTGELALCVYVSQYACIPSIWDICTSFPFFLQNTILGSLLCASHNGMLLQCGKCVSLYACVRLCMNTYINLYIYIYIYTVCVCVCLARWMLLQCDKCMFSLYVLIYMYIYSACVCTYVYVCVLGRMRYNCVCWVCVFHCIFICVCAYMCYVWCVRVYVCLCVLVAIGGWCYSKRGYVVGAIARGVMWLVL
jgi:hypothetical protein